jgi:hypothetical protein
MKLQQLKVMPVEIIIIQERSVGQEVVVQEIRVKEQVLHFNLLQ